MQVLLPVTIYSCMPQLMSEVTLVAWQGNARLGVTW